MAKAALIHYFALVSATVALSRQDDQGNTLPGTKNVPLCQYVYMSNDTPQSQQNLFQGAMTFLIDSTVNHPEFGYIWGDVHPTAEQDDPEALAQVRGYISQRLSLTHYYTAIDENPPEYVVNPPKAPKTPGAARSARPDKKAPPAGRKSTRKRR